MKTQTYTPNPHTTVTLQKHPRFWQVILRHDDGAVNVYRFATKREAQDWLRTAGL